ncbi:hypothetical protein [Halobacillus sp. BBL2006]|uniref:hypothetical protein n=1 Tax=Halobacillus sp. BBL2006 TaxID=1543706 RepID=UPI0005422C4D|nr:hypothetical protein [Halobacillus sp. BBL2006]KHE73149.1 hypothetical protein LD39_00725 [Halobacillus sp. BBL2006]
MAENLPAGRLPKEENPTPGDRAGFAGSWQDADGTYKRTGKANPLPITDAQVLAKLLDLDTKQQAVLDKLNDKINTQLTGSKLQEQKTEADASTGVVNFSSNIEAIEIYNRDSVDGIFNVNNLDITVPANDSFQATVGGTPSNEVSVSGSTSYIIGRYA